MSASPFPIVDGNTSSVEDRAGTLAEAAILTLCSCLPVLGTVLVAPLLPSIQANFAADPLAGTLTPLVIGGPPLLIAIVSPLSGAIADRWGKRRLLIASLALYAMLGVLPVLLSSLRWIVVARLALGVPEGAILTVATALIGDYFSGRRRDRIFATQAMATSASAVIFVVVSGALGTLGWRSPFLIYLAAAALIPFAVFIVVEPKSHHRAALSAPAPFPFAKLLPLYGLVIAGSIGFYMVPTEVAFLLKGIARAEPALAGLFNGADQLAVLISASLFPFLRKAGLRVLIVVGFLLTGVGIMVMANGSVLAVICAGAVISGLGSGLLLPSFITAVMSLLLPPQRGRGAGGFTMAFCGGQFLCPVTMAALAHLTGSLVEAVTIGGILMIVSAPFALRLVGKESG